MSDPVLIRSRLLSGYPAVVSGVSTSRGGVSPEPLGMNLSYSVGDDPAFVSRNRLLFFQSLDARAESLATPDQCHSAVVRVADRPHRYPSCDGLISAVRGITLGVTVADCVPLLLFDPRREVFAALHAGWRGTQKGIVRAGITLMAEQFGSQPQDVIAYLGPSASVCCYEVGPDVARLFSPSALRVDDGRTFLDLKRENKSQLQQSGVREENIEVSAHCTICESSLFHSYRRDTTRSGRMLGVIGLKQNGAQ